MRNSITTRLITLLTVCLTAIFGGGMLLDYQLSRGEVLERLRVQSEDTVRSAVTDMENWLDGVEDSTRFLARILEQGDYTGSDLEQMLKGIVENNEDIFGATIALNPERVSDPLGFAPYYYHREGILSYANLAEEQYDYRSQAWFADTAAAGKPIWVEPYFDDGGGEALMTTFAVPVYRRDDAERGSLYAVVTADVQLSELHNYLRRLRLGESGNAFLLSRTGVILSSKKPAEILQHYSNVISDRLDLAAWEEMFRSALDGRTLTRQLQCPELQGNCVMRLGSLDSTGWPVGITYSESEMLAPLRRFQLKTLLLGCVTLLLMALAISLVTRRLTRPLTTLAEASHEIARGRLDTPLPAVRGEDEVAGLVRAFATMQGDLKHYIADLEAATASRNRLEGELNAARKIQMSLLPHGGQASGRFRDCELWARVRPARTVGGDLYFYLEKGQKLCIAVGDVSDKGVPAALFMAKAISLLPQLAGPDSDPARAMALLNDALEEGNDNCMFVTLFLGILDLASRELRFASAGHTPPSLLRQGAARSLPQKDGPALGLAPGLTYPDNTLQLQPGDRLAIFTDGIDEAFNDRAEMFGMNRFHGELSDGAVEPPEAAGEALFQALDSFAGEVPQSDDITLMLLQFSGDSGQQKQPTSATFSRGAGLVGRVTDWLQAVLQQLEVGTETGMELVLVAEEIVTNIDKYAGLPADGGIELTVRPTPGRVELVAVDGGRPFNPIDEAKRSDLGAGIDSAGIGGLGVHLITQLTDRQSYERCNGSNVLRVVKFLADVAPGGQRGMGGHKREAEGNMDLSTTVVVDEANSLARVSLDGALNTDTAPAFEQRLQKVIDEGYPLTVLDMKQLDYISSAGLRIIFKAAKQCKAAGNRLAAANRKPHIDKVFEILKALPDMAVFANDQELDDYLDTMQRRVRDE